VPLPLPGKLDPKTAMVNTETISDDGKARGRLPQQPRRRAGPATDRGRVDLRELTGAEELTWSALQLAAWGA
jgi:hypothetical protein